MAAPALPALLRQRRAFQSGRLGHLRIPPPKPAPGGLGLLRQPHLHGSPGSPVFGYEPGAIGQVFRRFRLQRGEFGRDQRLKQQHGSGSGGSPPAPHDSLVVVIVFRDASTSKLGVFIHKLTVNDVYYVCRRDIITLTTPFKARWTNGARITASTGRHPAKEGVGNRARVRRSRRKIRSKKIRWCGETGGWEETNVKSYKIVPSNALKFLVKLFIRINLRIS